MDLDVLNWKSVNFGTVGFNANFEGLAGIEECTDYGIVSKNRRKRVSKKGNKPLKRKSPIVENDIPTPKKTKSSISNGFEVEEVVSEILVSPSKGTQKKEFKHKNNGEDKANQNKKENKTVKTSKNVALEKENDSDKTSKNKTKLEEDKKTTKKSKRKKHKKKKANEENIIKENNVEDIELKDVDVEIDVSLDDMQAWSRFNLPDSILKGLAVQNFKNPTLIQEMTLPSALFGRRDILGAAETGSGKTLAFGLPILNAILQMKDKPFMGMKETFRKPKKMRGEETVKKNEQAKIVNFNKLSKDEKKKVLNEIKHEAKMQRTMKSVEMEEQDSDASDVESESDSDEEDLRIDSENSELEENELENYSDLDEDNDVDSELDDANDSENSELDDEDENISKSVKKYDSGIEGDGAKSGTSNDDSDFEEKEEAAEGVNEKGIGCVKVIDNIISEDLPQNNLVKTDMKPLYALILTPTRELAIQVKNHLTSAAKFTGISVAVVVGGMSQEKQERLLGRGPEIVVATPGRLWQLIQMGNPHLSQIPDIKFLAIDETDRMLEHGHFEELHQLLERINEDDTKRGSRQNFVFSATLTMVHDLPKHLKKKRVTKKGRIINKKVIKLTPDQKLKKVIDMLGISDPKIVDITTQNQGTSTTLMECRIVCSIEQKDYYLYYVLKRHPGRTIVFCNSIGCVKRLSQLFGLLQCNPLPLHANMQQRQRLKNLDKFRADNYGVLVATDVAARGLDIPDVEHVIHYQVPRTAENYVHRSGRTARATKEGITILIMEAGEVQNYNKMCKTLEKKEDLPHFPVDNPLLSAVMQRVDAARELDLMMLKIRKDNSQKGWLEKAAKEMDMLLDENDMPKRLEDEASTNMKKALSMNRKHLNSLLATPLFPKGFSFKYPSSNILLQEALGLTEGQNAIQALKTSLKIGAVKKKNTTKNEALLKLEKKINATVKVTSQTTVKDKGVASEEIIPNGEKVSKNKWKKMRKNKNT